MREPHDTLPVPAEWIAPSRAWLTFTWTANRPATDTRAVRIDEPDGEPATLIGFSVSMWRAEPVVAVVLGGVFIWWIATYWTEVLAVGPLGAIWLVVALVTVPVILIRQVINVIAGPGELALSRNGVRLRPDATWTYLPWSAARGVEAELERDGDGGWQRFITITCDSPQSLRTGGLPRLFRRRLIRRRDALRIHVSPIAINHVLLYHVVRFYYEHPHARDELGTIASLDRIRRRDFP